MVKPRRKIQWILFGCFLLLLLVFRLWLGFWVKSRDQFYVKAYTPMVERSLKNQQSTNTTDTSDDTPSSEPQPKGFRESDIKKQHGEGFSTY